MSESLTPLEVADKLLRECFGNRDNAAQIADRKRAETFAAMPWASQIYHGAHKILSEPEPAIYDKPKA